MTAPAQVRRSGRSPIGAEVRLEPYARGLGLPVFVEPVDPALSNDTAAVVAWLRDREETLDALLCEVGAVVLRGFALPDTDAFCQAIGHYPELANGYLGGATPRSVVKGRAYEATRVPADRKLMFHQEMAYLPTYPSKLAFYCKQAPETGGETLIADVRRFDEAIPRSFRDEVKRRGVRYIRNFRDPDWQVGHPFLDQVHLTWTHAFATTDPREAEAACRAMGMEYEWEANGSLSVTYTASGFARHPRTGREIWFNQIQSQMPNPTDGGYARLALEAEVYGGRGPPSLRVTFGDGGPITLESLEPLYDVLAQIEVAFPWRNGDLMLLDNFYVFHGRGPYTGYRDVQVALLG